MCAIALAEQNTIDSYNQKPSGRSIRIAGVTHSFGEGVQTKPVLSGIDLTLESGEFVVLTGPSGAGKTTLLTLIGTLRTLQQGSITVLGTELFGLTPAQQRHLRRRIGFIFQDHNLFDALTVFHTLRLATELAEVRPSRSEVQNKAHCLLAQIGMENYMQARPGQLSTGQKQRVAIARALINDPELILADEPTASLDQASAQSVIDLLKRRSQSQKATVLMVTHDHRIFAVADRVVHMVDGRIA
jgi:putative ABC transport system ATP-binding protein